jgi:hypothetical protein
MLAKWCVSLHDSGSGSVLLDVERAFVFIIVLYNKEKSMKENYRKIVQLLKGIVLRDFEVYFYDVIQ